MCNTIWETKQRACYMCWPPEAPKDWHIVRVTFSFVQNYLWVLSTWSIAFPPTHKSWSHHSSRQVLVPRRLRWLWDQDCQENSHNQQPLGLHFFHCPFTFSSVFWLVHSYLGLMFPHHSEDLWWLNPPSYILILLVHKQNDRYSKWQWRNVLCHVYNRNIHWSVNF